MLNSEQIKSLADTELRLSEGISQSDTVYVQIFVGCKFCRFCDWLAIREFFILENL